MNFAGGGVLFRHETLIKAANDLEPLNASITRLAAILANENWEMRDVEQVVSLDQALTVRLLRIANSAAVASRSPIATVKDAVVRLGTGSVLSIAMAAGVRQQMEVSIPEYGLSEGELWRHAVATALVAEMIPMVLNKRVPPESFTAALLHDIGKLLLARFLDPQPLRFLKMARDQGGASSMMAEVEILGVHHGELGGLVAQHWKLPERLVKGIIYHHSPADGRDPICDVVHVANIVARRMGTGGEAIDKDLQFEPGSLERLKTDEQGIDELAGRATERLEQVIARYE